MEHEARQSAERNVVVIRRYPNRRLYDTRSSRYVTLGEITTLVENGTDVQVIDAKTGEDVTRAVLFQIVVQVMEQEAGTVLSSAVLHQVIRVRSAMTWPAFVTRVIEVLNTFQFGGNGGTGDLFTQGSMETKGEQRLAALEARMCELERKVAWLMGRKETGDYPGKQKPKGEQVQPGPQDSHSLSELHLRGGNKQPPASKPGKPPSKPGNPPSNPGKPPSQPPPPPPPVGQADSVVT